MTPEQIAGLGEGVISRLPATDAAFWCWLYPQLTAAQRAALTPEQLALLASAGCTSGSPTPTSTPIPTPRPPTPTPPGPPAGPALAPYCRPDQVPVYRYGFATLAELLGPVMGDPLTCEYGDSNPTGDTHQTTSQGLAFYRFSTNTPTFTNGFEHWAWTPRELVYWTGDSIDPPPDAQVVS